MRVRAGLIGVALGIAAMASSCKLFNPQNGPADNLSSSGLMSDSAIQSEREFRGAWISTVYNLDWPSKSGLSAAEQKAQMVAMLDNLKKYHINAVLFQTRPEGDALYRSQLEPWSRYLTGKQGGDPGYDPLEYLVQEAHKRGMEAHVWLNPYRAKASSKSVNVKPHISETHPQFVYNYRNLAWMDPGAPAVQDHTYNVVMDMVKRYDIDGVHIDDYFYPYPDGTPFPDDKTYAAYKKTGGTLERDDWRRKNVDDLIARIHKGIRETKPWVKYGISPFGLYRPGYPEGTKGLDQYTALFADPKKWMEEGWVDYLAPQLYWKVNQKNLPYEGLLTWWTSIRQDRPIYAGLNASNLVAESPWEASEILNQVTISRKHRDKKALGQIYFKANNISNNHKGVGEGLAGIYAGPALAPALDHLNPERPEAPTVVKRENSAIPSHKKLGDLRFWALYREVEGKWQLERVESVEQNELSLGDGKYAIAAVSKFGAESPAVMVE